VELIRAARERVPAIVRVPAGEFGRLVAVDLELRSRVEAAVILKGSLPRTPQRPNVFRTAHQRA
jgi:hypothetical protein